MFEIVLGQVSEWAQNLGGVTHTHTHTHTHTRKLTPEDNSF